MKSQVVADKKTGKIICTAFANGRKHDFRLFKESKTNMQKEILSIQDTGYLGIDKIHVNVLLPKKKSKKKPLTKEDEKRNSEISSQRMLCENIIGTLKRYKILSEKYRNRRKRFTLRFNFIAGFYNFELSL